MLITTLKLTRMINSLIWQIFGCSARQNHIRHWFYCLGIWHELESGGKEFDIGLCRANTLSFLLVSYGMVGKSGRGILETGRSLSFGPTPAKITDVSLRIRPAPSKICVCSGAYPPLKKTLNAWIKNANLVDHLTLKVGRIVNKSESEKIAGALTLKNEDCCASVVSSSSHGFNIGELWKVGCRARTLSL